MKSSQNLPQSGESSLKPPVVKTIGKRQQTIKDVNATAIVNPTNDPRLLNQDFDLKDGDIIKVIPVNPGLLNKVELKSKSLQFICTSTSSKLSFFKL